MQALPASGPRETPHTCEDSEASRPTQTRSRRLCRADPYLQDRGSPDAPTGRPARPRRPGGCPDIAGTRGTLRLRAPRSLPGDRAEEPSRVCARSINGNEDALMPQLCAAACSHANCTLRTRVTRVPFPAQHGVGDLLNCKMKPREHSMRMD